MKKFLTVLLALSVVFTYTVGTAFAAISDPEEIQSAKDYYATLEASYLDGDFEQTADVYMKTLSFDDDGMLIATPKPTTEAAGLLSKAVIKEKVNTKIQDAITEFRAAVATARSNAITNGTNWDKAAMDTAVADVKDAFADAIANNISDDGIFGASDADVVKLMKAQLKLDVATAQTTLNIDSKNYSNDVAQWSIKIASKALAGAVAKGDNIATAVAGGSVPAAGWTYKDLTGANPADDAQGNATYIEFTAKSYVEAILDTQGKVVAANTKASAEDAASYKTVIDNVNGAAALAKAAILGHKAVSGEMYYVAAVPTIADLTDTSSLEETKANAVTQIQAALAAKKIELSSTMQDKINDLNRYASLSTAQKNTLATLKQQKAELDAQFAALEEVYKAKIGYCNSTDAVKTLISKTNGLLKAIDDLKNQADGTLQDSDVTALNAAITITKNVAKLNAESARRSELKDVNGKLYYDADTLKANTAKAVKALYNGSTYAAAEAMLAYGFEALLIDTKAEYIKFINGDTTTLVPVASNGQKVTTKWNKPAAVATISNEDVDVMAKGHVSNKYKVTETKMYDKEQKAELIALVKETKTSIEAAKSVAEIEKIFAEANDKYDAIATTEDHYDLWKTAGKVGAAYVKGDYDKDLYAYAAYFVKKADTDITDYPADVRDEYGVMMNVVYPIMYEAYTADELQAKAAEAKAAIDKIMTTKEVTAQKKAVEALVDALPKEVTLTDKAAIEAAYAANDAYGKIPGATAIVNQGILDAKVTAYESLAAKEFDAAYKALAQKTVTTSDKDAVESLRSTYEAYVAFCEDNGVAVADATSTYAKSGAVFADSNVVAIEDELLDAQVAEVKTLMTKLPANPTAKDKAQVEAARAAYEALSLEGKAKIVDTKEYQNLLDAEESLGLSAKYAVQSLKIKASSKAVKGKITVKWKVSGDTSAIDGYRVYKSTKMNSGYKFMGKTKKLYMDNKKNLKKGKRYFYKVRAYKVIDGKTYYSDYSNLANRYAK